MTATTQDSFVTTVTFLIVAASPIEADPQTLEKSQIFLQKF